ncbi:MAG: tetratricopeptide repeat protein, partial [Pseudorhodoplanes sp.]
LSLLAYLAMHAGQPVSRQQLARLLWCDRSEAAARQNLRQTILTLRRDLGTCGHRLVVTGQALAFDIEPSAVDALMFCARSESKDPAIRMGCLDVGWAPFMNRVSAGSAAFDRWVQSERQRLDTCATRTFLSLATHLDEVGDAENAIRAAERLVAIDPTEQGRHRRLLSLEFKYHGAEAAIGHGKSLASLLQQNFGVEPEPATLALIDEIRSGVKGLGARTEPTPAVSEPDPEIPEPPPTEPTTQKRTPSSKVRTAFAAAAALMLVSAGTFVLTEGFREAPPVPAAIQPASVSKRDAELKSPWRTPQVFPAASRGDDAVLGLIPIVVLPFTNHGATDEYGSMIADIVTDNLTNVIARIPIFRVISRQTAATYKTQKLGAAEIAAQLGVDYLIEGSAFLHESKLYINVALVDAKTQSQIWSGRYERPATDLASLLGEVVYGLGRELQIEVSHIQGLQRSESLNLQATVFKGWAAIDAAGRSGSAALKEALTHFNKALEINPDHVSARLGLASYHAHMALQLIASNPSEHIGKAEAILGVLIQRHPNINPPHALMGLVEIARNRPDEAMRHFKRSIELNPSHAPSYAQMGRLLVRQGSPQQGLEHIQYAMRLSPRDPAMPYWIAFAGYAELELGNYDVALEELKRAHALNPGQARTMLTLAAAHAMSGNLPQARAVLAELQMKRPHLTSSTLIKRYSHPSVRESRSAKGILRAIESEF